MNDTIDNQSITYQNHHLHYTIKGEGESILFLHGWPTNSKLWAAQVSALQSNFKTITLDWLGFGASDKPTSYHYTFENKQAELDHLLSKILNKNEKINIVAHDIGGPPAILWAATNPDRVKRLILLNTVLYPLKTPLDATSEVLFKTPLLWKLLMSPFGLKRIMLSNTKSKRAGLKDKIVDILNAYEKVNPHLKRRCIMEPMHEGRKQSLHQLSKIYKELEVPKYLIIAKEDPLCYAHIKKLSEENPEIPTFSIENCGHYIPIDRPEELNAILQKILLQKK